MIVARDTRCSGCAGSTTSHSSSCTAIAPLPLSTTVDAHDPVHRPSHYVVGGIEAIDVIEAFALDFHRGNAVKYVLRAGRKDPAKTVEDLKKARWYLDRAITRLERGGAS